MSNKKELKATLGLGLDFGGERIKDVQFMRTNGIAERVFTEKPASQPFTWYGNVISIATKNIGKHQIAAEVRANYEKNETVDIPDVVGELFLADANSLLIEIHRQCWQDVIKEQKIMCQFCPKHRVMDIDLNRIKFEPEDEKIFNIYAGTDLIVVDLPDGFEFVSPIRGTPDNPSNYAVYEGLEINRLIYRIPRLKDAIRSENVADDNVQFWRQIAFDCLVEMQSVDEDGEVTALPRDLNTLMGMKLYTTELTTKDLREVREALREEIPSLPFAYMDKCGCGQNKDIPIIMEASHFFGA